MEKLLVDVLNNALKAFQDNGGKVYPGDIVVDYNPENVKVASFIDRHPGWIKLYVTLEEGTGLFFIKSETTMFGNIYYIAWEEDNSSCSLAKLCNGNRDIYSVVRNELEKIVTKGLL